MSDDLAEDDLVEPVAPEFPKSVLIAGILWILFGGWGLVIGGLMFAVVGPIPSPVPFWGLIFGSASLYVGIHTVRGRARGMWGNAIGSIVFALFIFIHALSVITDLASQQQRPEILIAGVLDAAGTAFAGFGFLAAGVLALLGRDRYRAWRVSRENR